MTAGTNTDGNSIVRMFIEHLRYERGLSQHTVRAYSTDLHQYVMWIGGLQSNTGTKNVSLYQVDTATMRSWLTELTLAGENPRTVRRKIQSLRALYGFLVKRKGLANNPAADLKPAKMPQRLPVYATEAQSASMTDAAVDLINRGGKSFVAVRDALIASMIYNTGIRCEEATTLTDANVNIIANELKVLGKRNKERVIPFGTELAQMISYYRDLRAKTVGHAVERFFVRSDGSGLTSRTVYNACHRTMSGHINAQRLSPHVLRHSCATDMLNEGASLATISRMLGHASLATTQIYTHVTYSELNQAYHNAHPRARQQRDDNNE